MTKEVSHQAGLQGRIVREEGTVASGAALDRDCERQIDCSGCASPGLGRGSYLSTLSWLLTWFASALARFASSSTSCAFAWASCPSAWWSVALDAGRTPQRVSCGHLPDQGSNLGNGFWASAALPSGDPGPEEPEALAMPGHHGFGFDDD